MNCHNSYAPRQITLQQNLKLDSFSLVSKLTICIYKYNMLTTLLLQLVSLIDILFPRWINAIDDRTLLVNQGASSSGTSVPVKL